ncbi:MAG: DUF2780 domain-containing protein [Rubripirellula sp.]
MDELIKQLTAKLGIDESVANAATGKAMALVKEHAGEDLFSKISSAIPGAGEVADQGAAEPAGEEGGGMLGGLMGMASSALGGSAGEALGIGKDLSSAGLEASQIGGFASMVVEFLKEKVGDEVMEQILAKVPMLKSLMG